VSDNNQPIFRLIALGYSYIEIAQLCNRSVNTIKTIVRREQKRIKVTEAQLSPKASNTPGFDEDDLARIVQFEQDIRSGAYGIKNAARITEQLKPSQQAVWRLYVQGMNKHEIASSLHTDYGKVAWGLYTARCSLLATLKAQDAL
jgi:DNA-binding NarL/FixJ family response regulator